MVALDCTEAALPAGTALLAAAAVPPAAAPFVEQRIESWFRDHYAKLWRLVARLGASAHSIDDSVQDAFLTASRRHADIRDGCEWSFLVGTALRVSANYRLRASVRREVS